MSVLHPAPSAPTILIVDDNPVNITVLESFVRKLGYRAVSADSGAEALRLFEADRPDVVLLDLMMPGLNGGEVAQRMRVLAGRHWIPILIVSASSQEKDRTFSLDHGADGYLVKPVTFQALASELAAMRRIAELQQQLKVQLEQLQRYHDYIEDEQRLARYILKHLTPPPELDGLCALIQPARGFSGDYIAAAARPDGRIYLILADATGHGLSAAVCLIPVFTIFEGMVRKDHPIDQIAREMNRELKKRTPTGHFVAVTLALVDEERGTTEVWNGGNPAALLRCDGEREHEIRSSHPPVGLLHDARFDPTTRTVPWETSCELMFVSDGVVEANSPAGRQFGLDKVREVFRSSGDDDCRELLARVLEHAGDRPADDDMAVLSLRARRRPRTQAVTDDATARPCDLRLSLGPEQIRSLDLPALVAHWGSLMGWHPSLRNRVPLVLTELWINAVDHGLLRMESRLKDGPDGMERYFRLRSERLAALQTGSIEIAVRTHAGSGEVELSVEDSGPGFDFEPWTEAHPAPARHRAGRGLLAARSLAESLDFNEHGRRVEVRFRPRRETER